MAAHTYSQWTIYSAVTGREKSFTYDVATAFVEFNIECARALTLTAQNLESRIDSVIVAARRCIDNIESTINKWTPAEVDAFDWQCSTLAVRVLDRTTAALGIAALKATELVEPGFMPYSNVMKHGVNVLQSALSVLACASERDSSKQFFGSGTLAEVSAGGIADPNSIYGVSNRNPNQFEFLCSGIIADGVDLITDLCQLSSLPASNIGICSYEWQMAFPSLQLLDRSRWHVGDVLSARFFAVMLGGVTESDVLNRYRNQELFAFGWFDGAPLFPAFQIYARTGSPYRELAHLLESIDFEKCPGIALASWLGTFDDAQNMFRHQMLEAPGGLTLIWMQLRGRGVMKQIDFLADGTKVWAAPGAGVPAVSDIRSLYTEKQFGKLCGSSAYFQSVIEKSAGAMSQPTSIYRIISREHTPFYFSKASVGGGGGRFDLPSSGTTGTCYFAESVYGAITEVYGQMLLVDVQAILVRRVCKVRNFATIDELLNIRDSDVASRLNLKSTFLSTMDRAATQEFAARVNTIGFKGIIYSLKTHVGRLGYAIFGVAGCAQPEDSGLGSWSVEVNDVGDDNSFWQWIADEQVSKDPESVLIMPNQLPLKSISS